MPIPIFGTGLNASGQFLATGGTDPHYILTLNYLNNGSSAYVPRGANVIEGTSEAVSPGWPMVPGVWASDNLAQWIAPQLDVVSIPGVGFDTFYTYQTTFDLTGFNLSTVQLSGHWTADNYLAQVSLNGNSIYTSNGCGPAGNFAFSTANAFSISSGFQAGVNTLAFNVTNSACVNVAPHTNPTGLLVDISGTGDFAVPEPGTMLGAVVGLALVASFYRLRRKTRA